MIFMLMRICKLLTTAISFLDLRFLSGRTVPVCSGYFSSSSLHFLFSAPSSYFHSFSYVCIKCCHSRKNPSCTHHCLQCFHLQPQNNSTGVSFFFLPSCSHSLSAQHCWVIWSHTTKYNRAQQASPFILKLKCVWMCNDLVAMPMLILILWIFGSNHPLIAVEIPGNARLCTITVHTKHKI